MLLASAAAAEWEAALPEGRERDLLALNRAMGNLEGLDRAGAQSKLQLKMEMEPYSLKGIQPKAAGFNGIFKVSAAELPPEMRDVGSLRLSFYVMKKGETYYLLTRKNFARLFAPVTNEKEVLRMLIAHGEIFNKSFPQIIGPDYKWKKPGDDFTLPKEPPPARSSVRKRKDGFDVRLIVYYGEYAEKRLLVRTDGGIEETQSLTVIKNLSRGPFRGPIP
jgi:hypothetical protein